MSQESRVKIWLEAMRPRTLPAAIAPVLVGTAMAFNAGSCRPVAALLCLVFSLLIQIGTNFANDYYDFIKKADTAERVGPRRAVAAGLIAPGVMKRAMWFTFATAFISGLSLIYWGGPWLLLIGIASVVCGIAYTGGPFPLAYLGLGDVFVFVFFGLVAVGATFFVQTGTVTGEVMLAASAVGALAANILVVNNYRDVETDAKANKRTIVVRFGRAYARAQFAASHLLALGVLAFFAVTMPKLIWLGWVCVVLATIIAIRQIRALAQAQTPPELIALLGKTGQYLFIYSLLLGLTQVVRGV